MPTLPNAYAPTYRPGRLVLSILVIARPFTWRLQVRLFSTPSIIRKIWEILQNCNDSCCNYKHNVKTFEIDRRQLYHEKKKKKNTVEHNIAWKGYTENSDSSAAVQVVV